MIITKQTLFKGSIIASIAHAIMTNIYPDFAYEQSWDELNYYIQDSEGLRGTITFRNDYCICAIRNEASQSSCNGKHTETLIKSFPQDIIDIAQRETLQYLLVEVKGKAVPVITSMFWADDTAMHFHKDNTFDLKNDLTLFDKIILPEEKAIESWKDYYDMDLSSLKLLKFLLNEKINDFNKKIVLDKYSKKLIPAKKINSECKISMKELNIII